MFSKVNQKQSFPKMEEDVLKFWQENKIFEESILKRDINKQYSFFDGPPFATGTPHYGHLLAGFIKDVMPRFKTMQGYRVERKWGWDTHGLPIENIVEKELGLVNKKQIEDFGIDNFNEKCRSKVLEFADIWKEQVSRTGRWVDMDNAYLTMNPEYMESIWWVFKQLYENKLINPGYKVMPFCPRCSTPLSNFETGQGYADKKDKAITVKFLLENEKNTYILAWTTTSWTLPSNLALAVGENIKYVKVRHEDEFFIIAEDRLEQYGLSTAEQVETFKGNNLVGRKYKPVFDYFKNSENSFRIISGDYVSTSDGTGIVHIAPAFGEDDYRISKENKIGFVNPVDEFGRFTSEVTDFADLSVVDQETNNKIIELLKNIGSVFKIETITHSYPHCYRCDTPLIYRAVESWFVDVPKIKEKILKNNKKIYWMPDHVGSGRFNNLLENAPEWNISRNRYWGTPLPIWQCKNCNKNIVVGSIQELEELSNEKITDLHLHKIKHIELNCSCGNRATLTGEVLDCWFESGSMPYASNHYPFEEARNFKNIFPADFIAEGIDQTRGWFNSLLILSTALFDQPAMRNVIVNGIILAEDGQKMSKRLKNYPDPMEIIHKYGADALRFYLMSSPAVHAEDLRFSEKGVDEVVKKIVLTLWNSYSFFVTYASIDNFKPTNKLDLKSSLDYWIVSEVNQLIKNVTDSLEAYDLSSASKFLAEFIDDLSNWYIRRSRRRFWKSENDLDKNQAYETLYYVLNAYIRLLAPIMPFITESIYQNLVLKIDSKQPQSVHLCDWPEYEESRINLKANKEIHLARRVVEMGLRLRGQEKINVRQPLKSLTIFNTERNNISKEILQSIAEELNVKEVVISDLSTNESTKVEVSTNINFKLVGPKIGNKVKDVSKALKEGDYKKVGENYLVLSETFSPEEIEVRINVEKNNSVVATEGDIAVALDIEISAELEEEGIARELVRQIQELRKAADFNVSDRIALGFNTDSNRLRTVLTEKWGQYISNEILANKICEDSTETFDYEEERMINSDKVLLKVRRD